MSEDWISTIKEQIRQELGELVDHSPAIHDFFVALALGALASNLDGAL